jgi:WD40 repeat protein
MPRSLASSLAVAPDDLTIATGHHGGKIRLWDAVSGKERVLERHQHGVAALAFRPDGKALLSGGWDNLAVLWDLGQRRDRYVWNGHTAGLTVARSQPRYCRQSMPRAVRRWVGCGRGEKWTQ